MNQAIENFIESEEIAVVGVSQKKSGGAIYKTLKKRGYQVYPVHPQHEQFEGDKCYSTLVDLPDSVTAAVIAVGPENAAQVLADARASQVKKLWFQQGPDFGSLTADADDAGFEVVSGKCILMYAQPVTGIHAVHRFLAKLFGKL